MTVPTILAIILLSGNFVFSFGVILNGNRYEDIDIVIEDNVDEDIELLEQIQESFTRASAVLYKATRHHVYFGKFRIIVPRNWTFMPSYKSSPTVTLTDSHILIGTVRDQTPHVRPNKVCGTAGEFMHLSPTIIKTTRSVFGLRENVIVHEWGHLRWGLKDEGPIPTLPKFYDAGDLRKPIKCSQSIQGTIGIGNACIQDQVKCNLQNSLTDLIKNDCSFCPDLNQEGNGASIMYAQYVDALYYFCDKNGTDVPEEQIHDKIPRTTHNTLCNSRSAWEVMRDHSDFANLSPMQSDIDTTPEFEIVQEGDGFRVLVLDVSGSMGTSRYVIDKLLPSNSWIGIVTFSTTASISIGLTQIISDSDRTLLKTNLPYTVAGYTCIGCGIDTALEVFRQMFNDLENFEVVLVSDGGDNRGDLDTSIQNALDAKIVVHTIAIEQSADSRLAEISELTGGNHLVYLEVGQISFSAVFSKVISKGATRANANIAMILSETINFISSSAMLFTFSIDEGLGNSTSVTVMIGSNAYLTIEVKGPNDLVQTYQGYSTEVTLDILGTAPKGDYEVNVTSSVDGTGEIVVVSSPTSGDGVIRLSTTLGNTTFDASSGTLPIIYASLNKNSFPVLGAVVFATVEFAGDFRNLDLSDNGLDPDLIPEDGIYSGYISPDCIVNGRISIKVLARGVGGKIRLMSGYPNAASPEVDITYKTIESSFGRSDVAEELNVINYNPFSADIIVPGKVTDLKVYNIKSSNSPTNGSLIITLQWSPTGDDKSYGTASAYDVRQSNVFDTFLDDGLFATAERVYFKNITDNTTVTVEHQFTIVVTENTTNSIYVALKAVDDASNYGPISNIVTISLQRSIVVDSGDIDEAPDDTTSDSNAIMIGVVVPVVLLLLILSSVIIYKFLLKKKTQVLDVEHRENTTSIEHFTTSDTADIHLPASSVFTTEVRSDSSHTSKIADDSYHSEHGNKSKNQAHCSTEPIEPIQQNASSEMAVLPVDFSKEVDIDRICEHIADKPSAEAFVKNIDDDQFGDPDTYIRFGVQNTHRLIPPILKTPLDKTTNEMTHSDEDLYLDEMDTDTEDYDSYIRQPQTPVPPMNWTLKPRNPERVNTPAEGSSLDLGPW